MPEFIDPVSRGRRGLQLQIAAPRSVLSQKHGPSPPDAVSPNCPGRANTGNLGIKHVIGRIRQGKPGRVTAVLAVILLPFALIGVGGNLVVFLSMFR
jgi:hypothetical protein